MVIRKNAGFESLPASSSISIQMSEFKTYEVWINVYQFIPGVKAKRKGGKKCIRVMDMLEAEHIIIALDTMAKLQGWTRNDAYPVIVHGDNFIIDRFNEGSFTAVELVQCKAPSRVIMSKELSK